MSHIISIVNDNMYYNNFSVVILAVLHTYLLQVVCSMKYKNNYQTSALLWKYQQRKAKENVKYSPNAAAENKVLSSNCILDSVIVTFEHFQVYFKWQKYNALIYEHMYASMPVLSMIV